MFFNELDFGQQGHLGFDEPGLDGAIAKAFFTALLLTKSPQRAEAAVAESIDYLNPEEPFEEAVLRGAVCAAIYASAGALPPNQQEEEAALAALPRQLRGVLGFTPNLRRCFVLRILLQLPREVCVRILHLTMKEIDQYTCEALWSLINLFHGQM